LVGEHAHEVRLHAQTISEVFDQDYKKTLETANVLVKKFKISWGAALDTIEEGLIEGGAANEEYLESLNEYAPFLADAGYSVGEFKNIIATGYDLGVFKDKLPDALKEFHLAMTDQTDTTRDALDNAFGITFTDKLFKGIEKGTITTKKALQEIIKESKKYGLSVQQQQQLTSGLFKGAGEDAGGALKIFEAINKALEDQTIVLTPLQQMLKETADAHRELAIAKDEALRSDDYVAFAGEMDLVWTKIQTIFYNALGGIRGAFTDSNEFIAKQIVLFLATTKAMPNIVSSNFR
ncbi:phage tail tape measure protein, partial [Aquimarina algiphila]